MVTQLCLNRIDSPNKPHDKHRQQETLKPPKNPTNTNMKSDVASRNWPKAHGWIATWQTGSMGGWKEVGGVHVPNWRVQSNY